MPLDSPPFRSSIPGEPTLHLNPSTRPVSTMAFTGPTPSRLLRHLAWLLLPLLAGCNPPEGDQMAQTAPVVRPVKSRVLPEAGGLARTFPGTLRATKRVELAFDLPGTLKELPVKEGQRVKAGQTLARLDSRDQKAAVAAAKAEYEKALADYKRAKELIKKHFVSQAHLDKTRAQKDIAASRLARARKALEETSLRAPFAGVIAHRYVENFTDVRAKQPILSLQEPRSLEVVVDIPEDLVASYRASTGLKASARFSTLPGRSFPLRLKEYSSQADPATRTYQVTFALSGNEGVNLLPGMTAEVTLTPGEAESGATPLFVLPATALFQADGKDWVWIIDPDSHKVERQEVRARPAGKNEVLVDSGLKPGQRIATAGVHHLKEGTQVRPVTEIRY